MKIIFSTVMCTLLMLPAAAQRPTMGWSSWNTYRVNISDSLIRKQAFAMAKNGLKEAGYEYINIDDGAFDGREPDGRLHAHATRFPQGLKPVVDYIHSLGLKAGTYSDAGRNTCGNYWDNDKGGVGIGLYGHEKADVNYLFNDLGFDFIKVDFCGGDPAQNTERLDLDEQTQYTAISQIIRAEAHRNVRLNVCRWAFPGTWVTEIAGSWRIAPDIQNNWASVKSIIDRNLFLSAYASPGHYNDMDMLEVGRGLTAEQERTHFGMWCMMSSPLLIGADLTSLSAETLSLITNPELIAINQDPLGQQGHVVSRQGAAYILVKDLLSSHGRTRAVAFYNPSDTTADMSITLSQLGYAKGKVKVRDAMQRCDMSPCESALSVSLPPHATRIYVLKGKRAETVRYEAENAWLSLYSAISEADCARVGYEEKGLSCGAKVGHLGDGSLKGNSMQWRHVFSHKGGRYRLTFRYLCKNASTLEVGINGKLVKRFIHLPSSPQGAECSVTVELKKGNNIIELGNTNGWAPDIDYMDVEQM